MRLFFAVVMTALALFHAGAHAELVVEQAYVRAMPPGAPTSAAFLSLVNRGDSDVVIDGASSDAAERVEIHAHVHEDGMMKMRRVDSVRVPAGGRFIFEPGAYHLMLLGLRNTLKPGESINIVLTSGNNEVVAAELPVQSISQHSHH